jgi:hypothetical protein
MTPTTMTVNKTVDEDDEDSLPSSTQPSTTRASEADAQEDKEMRDRIIKKEEKAVRNARLLVIVAIIACAVAVSTAIYIFSKKSDEDTFNLEVRSNRDGVVIRMDEVSNSNPHLMTHIIV